MPVSKKGFTLLCSFLMCAVFLFGEEQKDVVKVCWFPIPNYQETDKNGNRSGYIYEYLQRISEYAGFTYEYVDASQAEYKKLVLNGSVDIVCGLPDNDSTRSVCNLTQTSIGRQYSIIISRKDDDRFSFDDYKSMNGMTIAVFNINYYQKMFSFLEQQYGFKANLVSYETPKLAETALVYGNADLAIVNSFISTSDFNIVAQYDFHNFYIGVAKRKTELLSRIDRALQQINTQIPDYAVSLQNEYGSSSMQGQLSFSKEEKKFIIKNNFINVYLRADTPVLSYTDDRITKGFVPLVFSVIEKRSGLKFNLIPTNDSNVIIQKTKKDKNAIDGYAPANYKWAELNRFRLTFQVCEYPMVIVSRKQLDHAIYKVGYQDSSFVPESYLTNNDYKMISYRTRESAIKDVLHSKIDACLINIYSAQTFLSKAKYRSLVMSNVENIKPNLAFAIPNNADQELVTILNKTIRSISDTERSAYFQQSFAETYHYTLLDFIKDHASIIALIVIVFIAMFVIIIIQKRGEQRLETANKSKDIFLANMSHDFRTPLTAIKGLAYLGETDGDPKYYHQIITSSDYLLELVKDVLNIQQYSRGFQIELYPSAVKTEDIKQEVLTVINARAHTKHIAIDTDYQVVYPYLYIDSVRLKQVLINILNNAVKYSPNGSSITWKVTQQISNGTALFETEITDKGVGMSKDFLQNKLFHAFEREHNTLSVTEGGTGLGLAITKMIVDRMNGKIQVKSEIGQGTTFIITIPVEPLTKERYESIMQNQPKDNEAYDFNGKHILVCEDNELNTFIIRAILEKRGCIVDTAQDGETGIKLFSESAENKYDAILMDIRMPGIGGLEAAKRIRALGRHDAVVVPIIALSANAFSEDKAESYAAGMDAHISKPIDVDVLFSTLSKLLMLTK